MKRRLVVVIVVQQYMKISSPLIYIIAHTLKAVMVRKLFIYLIKSIKTCESNVFVSKLNLVKRFFSRTREWVLVFNKILNLDWHQIYCKNFSWEFKGYPRSYNPCTMYYNDRRAVRKRKCKREIFLHKARIVYNAFMI